MDNQAIQAEIKHIEWALKNPVSLIASGIAYLNGLRQALLWVLRDPEKEPAPLFCSQNRIPNFEDKTSI